MLLPARLAEVVVAASYATKECSTCGHEYGELRVTVHQISAASIARADHLHLDW